MIWFRFIGTGADRTLRHRYYDLPGGMSVYLPPAIHYAGQALIVMAQLRGAVRRVEVVR